MFKNFFNILDILAIMTGKKELSWKANLALKVWWKHFESPLISLYFASKESDIPIIFKVFLCSGSSGFLKVCQSFSLDLMPYHLQWNVWGFF